MQKAQKSAAVVSELEVVVPADYKCIDCGATNCKLWRAHAMTEPKLRCADCAAKHQKVDIGDIDSRGQYTSAITEQRTEGIGWYVPAMANNGEGFICSHNHLADECIICEGWWLRLPTRQQC